VRTLPEPIILPTATSCPLFLETRASFFQNSVPQKVTVGLTTGLLGHLSSSHRYKEDVKPMDNASTLLFALKPVTVLNAL